MLTVLLQVQIFLLSLTESIPLGIIEGKYEEGDGGGNLLSSMAANRD